ncbi:hypothetical protein QN085_20630 [Pseudomonas sp. M2(2023)]|uniref:hypothetical protein n=1 Tax=Pseudomonas TaxID=286 RepID=UPI002553EBFF|nr:MULTISPECIES: hypothetical protein [Pseudomonas]MDM9552979.1 hypothetical protein [Pseudomonas asiatica]WIV23056.1 hypothetical protein QN085_20630 [Pseudomonas sp. M2(2023)]
MPSAPSTEKVDATELPPIKVKALPRSSLRFHESCNMDWSAILPRGTTKETAVLSALWSVNSDQFHSFDHIHCIWEDRSAYAELLVLDAGRGYANVVMLSYHPLPALLVSEAGLPPGFECFYAGPIVNDEGGYQVKRLCDGCLIVRGKPNKEAAIAALLDHASLR